MYIHLLYGDTRLLYKYYKASCLCFKVTAYYGGVSYQICFSFLFSLINVNICDRFYLCRKIKTVLKQPVDRILAGMLINRHS